MKLELGKFEIKDIQFADKSYVENHVLYVNKEEVEALVLEDDKLNYRKGITTGWICKNTCFRWLLRSYSRKNRWIPGRCY